MRKPKCAVLMLVAMSLAAVAAAKEGKSIVLQENAVVAGHHLKSGDYNVTWQEHSPGATVTFRRDGKVTATAEAKLVDRDKKYSSTEVVFGLTAEGSRQIQEIRFRGSTQVLVFSE